MRFFFPFAALLVVTPLSGGFLRSQPAAIAQAPTPVPRVEVKAPAPGEAERIGASGTEFNYSLTDWAKQGHYKEIITAARLRLKNEPSHIGARYALAHALYSNGSYSESVTHAQELVKSPQYQNDKTANEMLQNAQLLAGNYPDQPPVSWMKNDVEETFDKWRAQAVALLDAEKYDEIERTAAALTDKPQMMSDGNWTLAAFHIGLWEEEERTEAKWKRAHARVEKWVAARPQSQLAQLCLARSWTNGAWIARGSAYAKDVSPEAWAIVEERQDKAAPIIRKMLNAPKAFSPLVFAAAQRYGRLGGAPRDWHDKLFERGVAQYPTYYNLHGERAALLLPRWDGEPGEWELEAARAADALGQGAAGDALYARIVWNQWTYYTNIQKETSVDWERTKRGFDAILKQHPGSLAAATIYVRLCHQFGDYDKAVQVFQIIGGRADASSWRDPAHFAQTRNFLLKAAL